MSKNNEIQRKSEHKIAFFHKMTKMHLRPSCIQPTKYPTKYYICNFSFNLKTAYCYFPDIRYTTCYLHQIEAILVLISLQTVSSPYSQYIKLTEYCIIYIIQDI